MNLWKRPLSQSLVLRPVIVASLWIQYAASTHSENALSIALGGTVAIFLLTITEPIWLWMVGILEPSTDGDSEGVS